jgi:hypothetical protein
MKRLLLLTMLLWLAHAPGTADPLDLEGGVFICHHPPALVWSHEGYPEGWCRHYLDHHAIHSCAEQNPRLDATGMDWTVWYVIAAWAEEKTWCGAEFGLGPFDPQLFTFTQWGPCFPSQGLEIRTPGWPGTRQGVALAIVDAPWAGNFVPIYWFEGYSYGGAGLIPLSVDPRTAFAGTSDCNAPLEKVYHYGLGQLGALGVGADGIAVCPIDESLGVCCVNAACHLLTEEECAALQGAFHPAWHSCEPENPCAPTPDAPGTWGALKDRYR